MSVSRVLDLFRLRAENPRGSTPEERMGYKSAMESMLLNAKPSDAPEVALVGLSGGIQGSAFTWENNGDLPGEFLSGARRGLREVEVVLGDFMDGLGLDVAVDGSYMVPRAAFP